MFLLIGSLFLLIYMFRQISKSRLQIEYAVYWSLLSIAIFILGLFPNIAEWGASLLGVQSPANLVYLFIIFILLMRQFSTTVKLSKLNQQITDLVQYTALSRVDESIKTKKQL